MIQLATLEASMTIIGPALAVSSVLVLRGAQEHNLVVFLAWTAFAITLAGIGIEGVVIWAEGKNLAAARYTVKAAGLSVGVMMLGIGLSFMLAPGLFTWFATPLMLSIFVFVFAAWNAENSHSRQPHERRQR